MMQSSDESRRTPGRIARIRPDGQWGECVAHLNLTSSAYLPILDDALARARQLPGRLFQRRYRRDPVSRHQHRHLWQAEQAWLA